MAADGGTAVLSKHPVTHHAVSRYCQRILGVELTADQRAGKGPPALAEAYCRLAGTTSEKVASIILCRAVAVICAADFNGDHIRVKTPDFVACVKAGIVVTIDPVYVPHKLKMPSRDEIRRKKMRSRRRYAR